MRHLSQSLLCIKMKSLQFAFGSLSQLCLPTVKVFDHALLAAPAN
jgi:hypothetical protein